MWGDVTANYYDTPYVLGLVIIILLLMVKLRETLLLLCARVRHVKVRMRSLLNSVKFTANLDTKLTSTGSMVISAEDSSVTVMPGIIIVVSRTTLVEVLSELSGFTTNS